MDSLFRKNLIAQAVRVCSGDLPGNKENAAIVLEVVEEQKWTDAIFGHQMTDKTLNLRIVCAIELGRDPTDQRLRIYNHG